MHEFPKARYFDLLLADEFLRLSADPSLLRQMLLARPLEGFVVIDEIQKIPLLLDEVQWLIEHKKMKFALCGSSARKLKRGHGNLLGGRALKFELYGLSAIELGSDFNLEQMLNRGYLPSHYQDPDYRMSLRSYVADYLKEEILSEGLTRSLPTFSRFLEVAALSDTALINFSNIARETGVSVKTAQAYYEILQDTLTGAFLPAYTKRLKRRSRLGPKFYFHDVGVVNSLCLRDVVRPKSELFGKAFENWVHHELRCLLSYQDSFWPLTYWALTSGTEVDFIVGDMLLAVEAKASEQIKEHHLKGLRELKGEFAHIKERMIVCLEKEVRKTQDGIWIIPFQTFVKALWSQNQIDHFSIANFLKSQTI